MNKPQITEATIDRALRQVMDPEMDCNIVDLGLVYGLRIEGARVTVEMTLTTRGCPMQASIARGVQNALLQLKDVKEVDVQLVWDPPWSPACMSDFGRAQTGVIAR
jgi:metal-sulfur cluster biosynthetic enzyme